MRTSPSCSAARSSASGGALCCAVTAADRGVNGGYRPDPFGHDPRGAVRPVRIAAPMALAPTTGHPLAQVLCDRLHLSRRADREDHGVLDDALDESGEHLSRTDLDEGCDALIGQILYGPCPLYWSRDLLCQLQPQILSM